MKSRVSIFIPTKNAGPEFATVLEKIYGQKEKQMEVIIVDSGSIDKTLKIASSFPTEIHEIMPEEFGHGKTRNLALKYSSADYIAFLSQDAVPADEYWLSNLLRNFSDEATAGVFSKQIPRKEAKEIQRFFYKYYFPNDKIIRPQKEYNSIQNGFFSNVSSCIKKDILQKYRFNDTILTTEDQEWAKRVTDHGFKTIYESESIVIHSHNHNIKKIFQSYFDSALALSEITKEEYSDFKKGSMEYISKEFMHVLLNKPTELPYWMVRNFVKVAGIFLGLNEKKLPLYWKRNLSLNKYYWKE